MNQTKKRSSTLKSGSEINMEKTNIHCTLNTEENSVPKNEPSTITQPILTESDFKRIAEMVQSTLNSQIEVLVKSVMDGIALTINKRFAELERENNRLSGELKTLQTKMETIEQASDTAEQYSRRNNVRIVGIPEPTANIDNTDELILEMATACNVEISRSDIDKSHRFGKSTKLKPRPIIVKFTTRNARDKFYKCRSKLKDIERFHAVFINEDLTHKRSLVFQHARKLYTEKRISQTWTVSGNICIKDTSGAISYISKMADITKLYN